ncbi:MAG: hypothetical protein WBM35_06880 [Candidatus Electrothrix sp.]
MGTRGNQPNPASNIWWMVPVIALVQLGKDKMAELCHPAVLFPAMTAFFLDCQRGLQLISSCRFLRWKRFGKNDLCSPGMYSDAFLPVNTDQPLCDAVHLADGTENIVFLRHKHGLKYKKQGGHYG